jgi:hypothetical protein
MSSFTGMFPPLQPFQPFPIDPGQEPGGRPRPRRWQPPVGWNVMLTPGLEGIQLSSFQQQRDYAEQPTIPRALVGSCKCLDPDTLIEMADGCQRPARDVRAGDWLSTGRVLASCDIGEHEQVEVRTRDGHVLRTTTDHPFVVGDRWVWAENLRPGDRLLVPERPSNTEMSEPDELFLLLGYLTGDGSTRAGAGTSFTNADEAVWERFTECVKALGGDLGWSASSGRATTRGVKGLDWLTRHHGLRGVTAHDKKMPDVVWRASHRQRELFLAALWECDGYWKADGGRTFYLATSSDRLGRDVQHMLGQMGLHATRRKHPGGSPERPWLYTRVNVASRDWARAYEWPFVLERRRPQPTEHATDVALPVVVSVTPLGLQPTWGMTVDSGVHVTEGVLTHNTDIINLLKDDLADNIVPTPMALEAMQGNPAKRKDFDSRKSEAADFLRFPDPTGHSRAFSDWLSIILEDQIVLDGVAIHLVPGKKGSGPCGSSLAGLAPIDASTVKVLIDMWGGRPLPPQPFAQVIQWGLPRNDLMDLLADFGPTSSLDDYYSLSSIREEFIEDGEEQFGADQLIYAVENRRVFTPYGLSPVASSMLAASILFARQLWQLSYYDGGSLPQVFLDPGESVATAEEARQLQEAINMLGGDLVNKFQVIVLPPGAKTMPQKDPDLSGQIDEWLTALLCMPFGKSISDLGITPKVAAMQSPAASRGAAQTASDRSTKASTIPRARTITDQIMNAILQRHLGQPDMMWNWGIEEGGESLKDQIDQQSELVKSCIISIDEARIALNRDPLGLPETSVPVFFGPQGIVPLGSPAQEALAQGAALPAGSNAPGAPDPPPPPPPSPDLSSLLGGSKPAATAAATGAKPGVKPTASSGDKPPASPSAAGSRGAQAQQAKPTGGTGAGSKPTAKPSAKPTPGKSARDERRVDAECEILARWLRKGRPLEEFTGRALSSAAMAAARRVLESVDA